jgi:hypothetical protein
MSTTVATVPVAASCAVRASRSRRRASLRTQSTDRRCVMAPRKARSDPFVASKRSACSQNCTNTSCVISSAAAVELVTRRARPYTRLPYRS